MQRWVDSWATVFAVSPAGFSVILSFEGENREVLPLQYSTVILSGVLAPK
jgi:hypothetical protein